MARRSAQSVQTRVPSRYAACVRGGQHAFNSPILSVVLIRESCDSGALRPTQPPHRHVFLPFASPNRSMLGASSNKAMLAEACLGILSV